MSQSLAVKYRPKDWDSMKGQKSIIKILKQQIETRKISNCYLFCGASGDGKTTSARIFARHLNNNFGEPIEIDGASNNSVDNVRNIIKSAQERSIDSEYKIFIIDEAHMLSNQAWNAFLKCIEEPPEFTIFIFCTTNPEKIPGTILNRVQRFNFLRLSPTDIRDRLEYICREENFYNYNESIDYISKICNGQMRDAIAYLEKSASYSYDLNINNVLTALGNYSYDVFFNLINSIIDCNEASIIDIVDNYYNNGNDLKLFVDEFLTFCMDLNKYCIFKSMSSLRIPSSMENKVIEATAINDNRKYYNYITNTLLELKNYVKQDLNIKCTVEIYLLRLARCA